MKKLYFSLCLVLVGISINAQTINFTDPDFKSLMVQASPQNIYAFNSLGQAMVVDTNSNGEIEVSEALEVQTLSLPGNNITSLGGIQSFANLMQLTCEWSSLTSLDLSGMIHMTAVSVSWSTNLASINVNGCDALMELRCAGTAITSIDVSNKPTLHYLQFGNCLSLNSINVDNCPHIIQIACDNCPILTLDVSDSYHLSYLYCGGCTQLQTLFIKNGSNESLGFEIQNCPNLNYICADDGQLTTVQNLITQYGYNCTVNSYCSFVPGGNYFSILGTSTFDADNNGCDGSDPVFKGLKLGFSGGAVGNTTTDVLGNYMLNLPEGTYTLSPVLENPTYFTVSPSSVPVTFPGQSSPMNQGFCVRPNGTHNDVEITFIPLTIARPGFDARYKIIYKNKGTHPRAGNVTLAFQDGIMDYVASSPNYTSISTDFLSWDYTNLLPFESREISVTFNVNAPTETPPVNIGDQLDFTANVYPIIGDEFNTDNKSTLKQPVVGSLDPNDKTCIEGNVVSTSVVGNYIHYLIRFENTGNYQAENVVVKDIIDTNRMIPGSLVPISSSHPMVTRFSATNKVEFIFENINLPFDDANNDGYVLFKVKTKSNLVVGNAISNTANIYFDYNAPIVTNTATSTIQALGNQDFEFSNYISLYPNPAQSILNIQAKNDIQISSINIYNTLGQLVLIIPNAKEINAIDTTSLIVGTYVIKVQSDRGMASAKFIKN